MADDLSEILARIEWARSEIQTLQSELMAFNQRAIRIYRIPHFTHRWLEIYAEQTEMIPVGIKSRSGTILNELRSCLDSLASVLAVRNGKTTNGVYFPIAENETDFDTDRKLKDKIQKLTPGDRDTIMALRPFAVARDGQPGNVLLYGLHRADVMRKHIGLVAHAHSGSVGLGHGRIGEVTGYSPTLEYKKPVVIARLSADTTVTVHFYPSFEYAAPDVLRGRGVVESLNEFADLVEATANAFRIDTACHGPAFSRI